MQKYILLTTLAALIIVLGYAALTLPAQTSTRVGEVSTPTPTQTPTPSTTPTPTPSQPSAGTGGYTMAQVATHNSALSCWAAINGNVYDLTNWINQHPGGPGPILSLCGTDGSAAFNAQHGGQRRPESELANFLIGPLKS